MQLPLRFPGRQFASLLLLLVALAAAPQTFADSAPDHEEARTMVKETTNSLIAALREEAQDGRPDADRIRELVDELVEPHLDFVTMTRLAVGRNWNQASNDEKRSLVEEFRELILRSYSSALAQVETYDEQEIEFLPLGESEHETRLEVESQVKMPEGDTLPISYGLRYTDGAWKLYDVVVDGVSLVTTYRSSFNTVVRRDGIEGLINNLEEKNDSGEADVPDIEAG